MSRELDLAFRTRYPRHGDRSRVVAKLIEMHLSGQLPPLNIELRSKQPTEVFVT